MAEDTGPESIVLRHLREISAQVGLVREDLRELKARVSAVEGGLNAVRRDLLILAEADARQQSTTDRLVDRVERIENRLSLRDA